MFYGIIAVMKINAEDIEFVSSYIEDGELNVLIGTRETCEVDIRWTLVFDPKTGELKNQSRCLATNNGIEEF